MTSKQIRSLQVETGSNDMQVKRQEFTNVMLQEIAAQLAEANEIKRFEIGLDEK